MKPGSMGLQQNRQNFFPGQEMGQQKSEAAANQPGQMSESNALGN
jgi:hypothetical protein